MKTHCTGIRAWAIPAAVAGLVSLALAQDYEPGGPLAGVKLPLHKTQHGEPPGYPGCIPELAAEARKKNPESTGFTPQGQFPEFELYPGAVEHWRAYWFHYMPIRSFFDKQSQIRNFMAPDIPGAAKEQGEEYAEPVYWEPRYGAAVNTGRRNRPVSVVRCRPGAPVFRLDLGTLEPGMYAVRVIGAVETARLRPFRQPVYVAMRVNDGLAGEVSAYRLRIGYCDEFYSVAEIYFHAPEKRAYRAELQVDRGSTVDLLVHNITLDDALAGSLHRAVKTRRTLHADLPPPAKKAGPRLTPEQRLARDEAIWRAAPPLNAQPISSTQSQNLAGGLADKISFGADGRTAAEIEAQWGRWEIAPYAADTYPDGTALVKDPAQWGAFLVNRKLGLQYTMQDFLARKPLPDPYPYKDDGAGLYWPDPQTPDVGRMWSPIAPNVNESLRRLFETAKSGASVWTQRADEEWARDGAVALIRFAYDSPAQDGANALLDLVRDPSAYSRDARCRRRNVSYTLVHDFGGHAQAWWLDPYDRLFDYVRGNEDLARSVGRFVPWVKNSQDVVRLLDVYLVQSVARRILRYQWSLDGDPHIILPSVMILGDNRVTDPWMDWLFARTWSYPFSPAGLPDYMIGARDRDGVQYIGSTGYACGPGAASDAEALAGYLKVGGNPKYDLSDPERFPKPVANCYWPLRMMVAGADMVRVGDVSGPDKAPGYMWYQFQRSGMAQKGWEWTKDPRFAFVLKHYLNHTGEDVAKAAEAVKRAPWLDQRSRVLPMWAGVLETGLQHDDYRFRRAAYVRVGYGYGHAHADTLDLHIVAHGIPMTIEGGQRSGYSEPGDKHTRVHNTVEVDGQNWNGYSWVRGISDAEGARYLVAEGSPPPTGSRLFRRQVALVDVDEGTGSRPLPPPQQLPRVKLPADVATANSYVFDCFRVSGGTKHRYCFHGPVNDPEGPQPKLNLPDAQMLEAAKEGDPVAAAARSLIGGLAGARCFGTAPDPFEALFHVQKQRVPPGAGEPHAGTETYFLGAAFDPQAPDKFLRLRLFNAGGALAMKGDHHCRTWRYYIPLTFVERAGQDLESAFAAVIEPYAGEPFINEAKSMDVRDNEADALRAVAIAVKTKNGRADVCFADGRPDKLREVASGATRLQVAGEFAYCSTDAQGLRQATLAGGTLLAAPGVRIEAAARERSATVTRVDYRRKTAWIDRPWPPVARESVVEIGTPPEREKGSAVTSFAVVSAQPDGAGTRLTFLHGADFYRSPVASVDEQAGIAAGILAPPGPVGGVPVPTRGWTASNDAVTKFWRAEILPGDDNAKRYPFRLSGAPVRAQDFAPENALRLWEYGPGDTVRRSTSVSLRRLDPGVYELSGDVDVRVTLAGGRVHTVTAADLAKAGGTLRLEAAGR